MNRFYYSFLLAALFFAFSGCSQTTSDSEDSTVLSDSSDYVLVIHGGAGSSRPGEDIQGQYHASMQRALKAGEAVLKEGGSALDAVIAAIVLLEDDSLFNAGRGAVLTREGHAELDASLMEGSQLDAGAIAGVKHVKNPILAARKVMQHSPHVMLAGDGADNFAAEQGLDTVSQNYFITQRRLRQHQKAIQGTVGAVARDKQGNLAAGTSTGGMSQKQWGRIGDSPIIGAGTYAHNQTCAISATGHGEFFIRNAVAHDIHARMMYGNKTLKEAASEIVHNVLREQWDANGGVIGVDQQGNVIMEFNTQVMFRGYVKANQKPVTYIFPKQ